MFNHPLVYRYNWIYFLLACLVLLLVMFFALHYGAGLPFSASLLDAASSILLLAIILIYVVNTLGFYHPTRYVFLFLFTGSLLLTVFYTVIIDLVLPVYYSEEDLSFVNEGVFWPRFGYAFFIFTGTMTTSWFYYRIKDLQAQLARHEQSDRVAKEAELYKLRQQMQPHFLFNSLNSINALIGTKPEQARKMVLQLSEFFRGTLKREENRFIPLKEEIDYIRLYLEIEQVRFGHRLQATIDVPEELLGLPVPPLVLQPIMENAIKFGLYGTIEDVCITVYARKVGSFLAIDIANPYDPTSAPAKGTGFGLAAVRRRLYLLFVRNDLLTTSQDEKTFCAHLKFPIGHDKNSDN